MSTTLVKPNIGVSKRYRPTVASEQHLRQWQALMELRNDFAEEARINGFSSDEEAVQYIKTEIRPEVYAEHNARWDKQCE